MSKDDSVYLQHTIDAIKRIEEYTSDVDNRDFTSNHLVQDGEAAKRVSKKLKDNNKHIPWKDIVGMRNKLIHDYFGVDADAVWDTVERDIPYLKTEIQKIINK